ncbi:hypothetical protein [Pontibacter akesuensis]|uniref:hypothetical protein n=1 Tax=Pontibacter akesuensis TaxID=388950 RepID=UPI0011133BF3|nr:hypothetical protein [Pontibacter akesuensis]
MEESKVRTDQDATFALYGSETLTSNYRMLKSRFRKKLNNHLHLVKLTDKYFDQHIIATQECLSLLHNGFTLMQLSEQRMADRKFDQVWELAKENELTDLGIKALEYKQTLCANSGNLKEYMRLDSLLHQERPLRAAEQEALKIYHLCMVQQKTNVKARAALLSQYPDTLAHMRSIWQSTGSSVVYSYYHILRINYLEFSGNYEGVVEAVIEANKLHTKGLINKAWYNHRFNLHIQIYALLRSKRYEEGLTLAAEAVNHFDQFSSNWYAVMENYILLALHARQYGLAVSLLEGALTEGHHAKISDIILERFELIRLHALLLEKVSWIDKVELKESFKGQLAFLPKDKTGFNLALLQLDILEVLAKPKNDLEQQAERVRKYTSKYLKGEKAERPRLFMRMLQLALQEHSLAVVQERGEKLLNKLKVTPLPGDAFAEVEVVPYEHLWALVLELLELRQKH